MQDKFIYEYAIIRLVPQVERGEFLNVGVILFSKKLKYLKMKYELDESRFAIFSSDIDFAEINGYLKGWESICAGSETGGPVAQSEIQVRFRWLTAKKSTVIQTSPVHSGLCEEMDERLEKLFQEYVVV